MIKKLNLIILSLVLLISQSCRERDIINHDQEILFQMDYLNHAWGYQHYGFMVDNKGRILTYDNPEKWNFPDKNYILTEEQIAENISMCSISEVRVTEEDLEKYSSLIDKIASSKVTAMRNTGADAGSLQFICYRYSENSLIYKGFLVRAEGDFSAENLNFHSKKVISWMKEIDHEISSR